MLFRSAGPVSSMDVPVCAIFAPAFEVELDGKFGPLTCRETQSEDSKRDVRVKSQWRKFGLAGSAMCSSTAFVSLGDGVVDDRVRFLHLPAL